MKEEYAVAEKRDPRDETIDRLNDLLSAYRMAFAITTIAAGREALRMIMAAKEGRGSGSGCSGDESGNQAGSGVGRTAYPIEDYGVCGGSG